MPAVQHGHYSTHRLHNKSVFHRLSQLVGKTSAYHTSKQKASQEQQRRLFSTVIAVRLPRHGKAALPSSP